MFVYFNYDSKKEIATEWNVLKFWGLNIMAHKVSIYVDVIGQWMNINWAFIINWKFSNYNQYGKKNFRAKWWCKSQETFHALQVFHIGITQ